MAPLRALEPLVCTTLQEKVPRPTSPKRKWVAGRAIKHYWKGQGPKERNGELFTTTRDPLLELTLNGNFRQCTSRRKLAGQSKTVHPW